MSRKSNYPKKAKTFGQKITKRRMDLSLTLKNISDEVGISESYLSRIEKDLQFPTKKLIVKIAKSLNLTVSYSLVPSGVES